MLRLAARGLWRTQAGRSICSSSAACSEATQQSKEVRPSGWGGGQRGGLGRRDAPGLGRRRRRAGGRRGRSEPLPPSYPALLQEFLKRFEPFQGNLTPPDFPSNFMPKAAVVDEAAPAAGVPAKLAFNFFVPHETVCQGQKVDLVLMPAVTGDFGVMPGHVPTVAQLRCGAVWVWVRGGGGGRAHRLRLPALPA